MNFRIEAFAWQRTLIAHLIQLIVHYISLYLHVIQKVEMCFLLQSELHFHPAVWLNSNKYFLN